MYPANITRDEAQARSALLQTSAYRIRLDLSGRGAGGLALADPTVVFLSETEVRFSSSAGRTTINLIADTVLSAVLDHEFVDFTDYDGEHLELSLAEGEHVLTVEALCRYSRTGEGLHRFVDPVDGNVYCYTQFEAADSRRAFAVFEQPDLKATFQLTVDAPDDWTVISNAPAVRPTAIADGIGRWEFAPTPPIASYITAIVAGPFHTVYDVYQQADRPLTLSVSCRQSIKQYLDSERILTTTKRGFEVFEEHFGIPYPFGDYAQIFVPEFNAGAMENAGCVTIRDEYLYRSRVTQASYESRDNTILHELAHMWFGDLVTMTWWDDLWLNESFAEWASHFAQELIVEKTGEGPDPWATFCNQRKTWAYRADQLPSTHPVAADMVDLEAVELNFDGITYAKGASVLKQLVAYVGREPFLAGVRAYFRAHAWGNTQLSDLLSALEEASGRDLSHFSDQWLQSAGVNTLRAAFACDEAGRFTSFTIQQTAAMAYRTLRNHRLAVGLYDLVDGRLSRVGHVEIDISGPATAVGELVGVQRPAVILLNDGDLTYAKIRLDAASLAAVTAGIATLDDPLARALCWGAAWDMCRDGELPASDYVDLVLSGVGTETDQTAVRSVLAQARTAVDYYAPRAQRAALNDHLLGGLARLLKNAAPGSDHQLAFSRALASAVTDEVGATLLQAWLDGHEVPEGLEIDTDARWQFVSELARLGLADEAVIAAELERDNTSSGAEKAAGARAARPTQNAKADAWHLATGPDLAPNETHYQVCAAFWQFDQDDVLTPYKEQYLEQVRAVSDQRDHWAGASSVLRQHVVRLLFPRPLADAAFLARLDA
ncbi:MAG: aminopeptidase N, partial [Propionibacteriaceae bacterium]